MLWKFSNTYKSNKDPIMHFHEYITSFRMIDSWPVLFLYKFLYACSFPSSWIILKIISDIILFNSYCKFKSLGGESKTFLSTTNTTLGNFGKYLLVLRLLHRSAYRFMEECHLFFFFLSLYFWNYAWLQSVVWECHWIKV